MSQRVPPLHIGIIGCGNVLSAYCIPLHNLRQRELAQVTFACGRDSQRESAFEFLGEHRFTTEPEEVIASSDVDVVLILTPMNQHAALAKSALLAGKHVLLEKPLATNFEDGQDLVVNANRSRGYLMCAPFVILSPTFQTMANRIRQGDIGKPCSARARYGWSGPWWSEWFYKLGGGCLFDLGVYCITSLTGLLGPARRVMAMAGVAIGRREINGRIIKVEAEDNAQVLLDFGENAFGVVTSGFTIQQYRNPALEVYGSTGTIQMLGDDWEPDGYEIWQNHIGAWQCYKETMPEWSWTDGLNHLIDCARTGRKPIVTPEHALHVLEIMLKAQQSAREGRSIALESTFHPLQFDRAVGQEPAHLMHDRSRGHAQGSPVN